MADASAGRTLEDRKRDLERAHAEGSTSTMDHAKLNSATARTPTSLATAAAAGDMDAVAAHISAKVDVNGEVDVSLISRRFLACCCPPQILLP
jgi:hypothetical protein